MIIFLNKRYILSLFSFLTIIFVNAIWSANIFTEWGTDFGVYYAGSYFIDENYRLYKEFFSHKGPIYYLFLRSVGLIFGWGFWQAYFSLFLTVLVFYLPIFIILIYERLNFQSFFAATLLSLCLLYGQDTNSSISFFQSGFLITSFWLLIRCGKNFFMLSASFSLFIFAVFTRIDAIIYLPVYLIALFLINYPNSIITFLKNIFFWFIILIIIFWLLSYTYDFNVNDYIIHNFTFNKWYASNLRSCNNFICTFAIYLIRPLSYKILTGSLLVLPLIFFSRQIRSAIHEIFLSIKNIIKKKSIKNYNPSNIYVSIIIIISGFSWFLTKSDKNYHLLIFLVPLLFFYLINFHILTRIKSIFIIFLAGYCLIITIFSPALKIYNDPECLYSPFCVSSNLNKSKESINFLKKSNYIKVSIVHGNGWFYFYSNKKPARSINDLWLYALDKSFLTPELINQHEKLLKNSGEQFLIDSELIDRVNNKNKLLKQILEKSELINNQNTYSVYQIK